MSILSESPAGHEPASTTTCFVIGPIGNQHAAPGTPERQTYEEALTVYEDVVRAACHHHGISVQRADEIADTGQITEQIRHRLLEADIVIADVSGVNPNVMFELGCRDMLHLPIILIGQYSDLPFSIAHMRAIQFQRERISFIRARDQLTHFLEAGINKGFTAVSPGSSRAQVASDHDAQGQVVDEPGLFDQMVVLEDAMGLVLEDIEGITESLHLITAAAEEISPRMEEVNRSQGSAGARLAVVKRLADAITGPAADMRKSADAFGARMHAIDQGIGAQLGFIESLSPQDRDQQVENFLETLIETADATRCGTENLAEFGELMQSLTSYSQLLRGPAQDVSRAARAITTVVDLTNAWEQRARSLRSES